MPSSSARCAQFPRAQDKVHFYIKLRELRDQLKGVQRSTEIQEVNYMFDLQLAKGKHDQGWVGGWVCVCMRMRVWVLFCFFLLKKCVTWLSNLNFTTKYLYSGFN